MSYRRVPSKRSEEWTRRFVPPDRVLQVRPARSALPACQCRRGRIGTATGVDYRFADCGMWSGYPPQKQKVLHGHVDVACAAQPLQTLLEGRMSFSNPHVHVIWLAQIPLLLLRSSSTVCRIESLYCMQRQVQLNHHFPKACQRKGFSQCRLTQQQTFRGKDVCS